MDTPRIHLIHSNRIERLADWLAGLIAREAPAAPLARTTIVVPHAGLGQWLEQALARRLGIACGFEFPLPARYLWTLVGRGLGELPERSPFTRGALVWRLYERLGRPLQGHALAPLAALDLQADPRARFELAEAIAKAFDRYLVYRPDTIARWERGGGGGLPHEDWQATLWRELVDGVASAHRARLLERYVRELRAGRIDAATLPETVYLFGLNPMPPPLWQAFEALSAHANVVAFVPDPCAKFWGEAADRQSPTGSMGTTHPLLVECGRLGRDFLRLVYAAEIEREEHRSDAPATRGTLLGRLHDSLLDADPARLAGAGVDADKSLTIHACAGPWREVEVLHDALLARFAADPGLKPGDVVVMVPELARFAPFFDAVFAHCAPERRLPFRIADLPATERSPLLAAFLRVLSLPQDRFALGDALAWAELPEVRARFDLESEAAAVGARWLAQAGVRWGLDGAHREQWGAGAGETGSLAFGIRRLLLGYALAEDGELAAGCAPAIELEGQDAALFGRLVELLGTLRRLRTELPRERTAAQWQAFLSAAFLALFAPAADARAYVEAEGLLRGALDRLVDDAAFAATQRPIAFEAWRAALGAALDEAGRGASFLSGAITICGMVPLRSVPFRVIGVLGLNEGVFPRREPTPAFDLLRVEPRLGDRSIAADDRYAFLEAIVAARDALHLSYSNVDPRGEAAAASRVLTGLLQLVTEHGFARDAGAARAALLTEHPVVPYAAAAFERGWAWPSYAVEWAAAARAEQMDPAPPVPFAAVVAPANVASRVLPLNRLIERLCRPQRAWLSRLGVQIARADPTGELHLSELTGLDRYRVRERVFELMRDGTVVDRAGLRARLAAEALLPPGAAGTDAADEAIAAVALLLERARELGWRAPGGPSPGFRLNLGGAILVGRVDAPSGQGLVRLRCGTLRARDLFGWWVQALAWVCGRGGAGLDVHALGLDADSSARELHLAVGADAGQRLAELVEIALRAEAEPLPLFPEAGMAYAAAIVGGAGEEAARLAASIAWTGKPRQRGESIDRSTAAFTRGWAVIDDPRFADLALRVHGPWLRAATEVAP